MTADDVRGEEYEAAKPTANRTRVTGDPWVREHLPECDLAKQCRNNVSHDDSGHGDCLHCGQMCECPRLRACEQRVLLSKPNIELSAVYGYEAGRSDGLNAARDAVEATEAANTSEGPYVFRARALAAIDALKGEA